MLHIADEVREALAAGGPVVALESTIVAHGFPFPDNLDVARGAEAAVRAGGAVPATIAVLGGVPRIGLGEAELEQLGREGAQMAKAGAADLAVHLSRGSSAATTVSATAFLAARAGIRVFATGGIGGVHRGDTGDVSSDLSTLASVPVACISAGAKAILDLPRTLETLETLGVLVVGYGTSELPGFYTRSTGLALEHRVDDVAELAALLHQRFDLLGQGGVLIANPIPDAAALPRSEIDQVVERALADAEAGGIHGKALTPFLLARIAEVSGGRAVTANRALAEANAALGAELACAYARRG
ncbi:pseudouridine-5'-phosphate glycosidase [Haliangium ochraceum]|uniref:Pseudouridine-5'-phosphate glycosidase n=1 Tax=Haliangium ochraceum (strain DSM 14365 / JCM 11303 / SMP-2) TaxID=502025 RepID=D0LJT2_HALO1|nr:pseudouridine-5'-phosphate glycosidase [Haliangium ochraceum]ACY18439.1 Indigoidine synthase A family protein [Haliangium ochraceum DSM 14365]